MAEAVVDFLLGLGIFFACLTVLLILQTSMTWWTPWRTTSGNTTGSMANHVSLTLPLSLSLILVFLEIFTCTSISQHFPPLPLQCSWNPGAVQSPQAYRLHKVHAGRAVCVMKVLCTNNLGWSVDWSVSQVRSSQVRSVSQVSVFVVWFVLCVVA